MTNDEMMDPDRLLAIYFEHSTGEDVGVNLANAYHLVGKQLSAFTNISESMQVLIDSCASQRPHPDWERLRSLPFDDLDALRRWIELPFYSQPPVRPLRGLWFGIFNPIYDGRPTSDFYICGSETFNSVPDDNSWATRPAWWPDARYAHSVVTKSIYDVAYGAGKLGNDAEYPLCLGYSAFVVRTLLQETNLARLLGTSNEIGVAVGFDSGDFLLLGNLTRAGLVPINDSNAPPALPKPI